VRAGAFLQAAAELPFKELDDLAGPGGLVVVAPHPDDESLGCGGLIAEARAQGRKVRVVILSDGIGSHPNSRNFPPDRLRRLRRQEARTAVALLGVADDALLFLDLPDRHLPSTGRGAEDAAASIVRIAREIAATSLFVTYEHDPHGDHQAAAAIARLAMPALRDCRLHAYPIWLWEVPAVTELEDVPRGARLDIARHLSAKRAAILAHRSQTTKLIDDDPEGFCTRPYILQRFDRPFEIYLEAAP
jgi:LmbE family N-acetylglucosaminyl deacetylase